jgi:hypothetical protein
VALGLLQGRPVHRGRRGLRDGRDRPQQFRQAAGQGRAALLLPRVRSRDVCHVRPAGGPWQEHHGLPLIERKARLRKLFTPKPNKTLLVMDAIPEHGIELFAMAVELELEGLVSKKKDSIYLPGERTRAWVKIKRSGAVPPERFRR